MIIQYLKLLEELLQTVEDLLFPKRYDDEKISILTVKSRKGKINSQESLIIAKPQYTYQDVKKLAITKGNLLKNIERYGIEDEFNNGYCLHHLRNKPHEFGSRKGKGSLAHYERICKTLNDKNFDTAYFDQLKEELENIVLVPIWYHRHLHTNKIKFSNRDECYKFLEKMLVSTEKCDEIEALKFDNSSIRKALDSVARVLIIPGALPNKKDFIDKLEVIFNEIKQDNINYLLPFVKPE